MNLRFSSSIRIISVIVLAFFLWSFGGVYELAYAANGHQPSAISGRNSNPSDQPSAVSNQPKVQKPEEKFQKAIDEIGSIVEKIKDKAEVEVKVEKEKLKAKRTEIESLDIEIRRQFTETEKKLKDSKLPDEILQRHYKFVKHYEDNLNELKTNLDNIEKAKDKAEVEVKVEETKKFLERVKPPKKHVPLDPNKLPHRTVEPVWKEPRLKPEEFLKDSSQYTVDSRQGTNYSSQQSVVSRQKKPILVASNGSLAGLLDSDSTLNAASYPLYAQANIPTPADLSETIEIQFTPEIKAKAAELGNNPVKIYNWVRNNIEFVPTYGSIQGANMCLQTKQCNDFDTASLLIALLRASNIHAKYVYGTIELPIEKVKNWVGGFTDTNSALTLIASGGIPVTGLTEGGVVKYVQMEHMSVEAYIPYGNYRGSMRDDSIKTWIPLDPSFKQYEYKRGMDLYTAMGINGEQYVMDYITDTSPSPIPPELQALFPDYTISPYQYYSRRLLNYIDTNFPDATIEDIIGDETVAISKSIIKKEYPYLLGSLPYKVIAKGATYSSIPSNYRHSISFSIENTFTYEIDLSYSVTLPEIAGKRITLSYMPATSTDEALVARYGGLLNVPPYLLNVKPVIKVNGVTVATGKSIGLGYEQLFYMTFRMPNKRSDTVTNKVVAGDYSAVTIQYFKTPSDLVADKMERLTKNIGSTDLDDLLGQMLYNIGLSYFHHLTFEEELYSKNFQMIITKEPSEAMVISQAITEWLWGVPYKVTEGGIGIDVDRNIYIPLPIDGDMNRLKDFMMVSGPGSSSWEDMILQSFFNIPSVSAARLLKTAHQRGIPIYKIDRSNIDISLPQLQVSQEVINDIRNNINAGKKVIISKTNIQYNEWNGVGYIILDPVKGSGAYMISGGLAGGGTSKKPDRSLRNPSDWSALITIFTRQAVIMIALSELDTPYVWGGDDPVCGFDCSGFVNYVFYVVYGGQAFPTSVNKAGQIVRFTAKQQYDYCQKKNWLYPFEEVLDGDIIWRSDKGHVGIYYSLFRAIHAIGRPCKTGELPQVPPECYKDVFEEQRLCGKYRKVVLTSLDEFKGKLQIDPYICRPQP